MWCRVVFFFQAEDGIRDLVRSRGLGDVYKRQVREVHPATAWPFLAHQDPGKAPPTEGPLNRDARAVSYTHLTLPTIYSV